MVVPGEQARERAQLIHVGARLANLQTQCIRSK